MTLDELSTQANQSLVNLCPELFVTLPAEVDGLLGEVATALQQQVKTQHVTLMHVLALKQTALAVRVLLGTGFPAQAMSLSANMLELAYELLYLRDDPTRLKTWHEHIEPGKKHRPKSDKMLGTRMLDGLVAAGVDDAEDKRDQDYALYSLLCDPKHSSPITLKTNGGFIKDGVLTMGPQDFSTKADWYHAVTAMSTIASMTVLGAYGAFHYYLQSNPQIFEKIEAFNALRKTAVDAGQTVIDHMED